MKFIYIVGPPAVGKMTVGQSLSRATGLKLFHNHMVMDLIGEFFEPFTDPEWGRLSQMFIEEILTSLAKSNMDGLIFTSVYNFAKSGRFDYSNRLVDIFASRGVDIYLVELEADLGARVERNKSPHRLAHKPSKRDVTKTEPGLSDTLTGERRNSIDGEIGIENYIRINNTNIEPDAAAEMIVRKFCL